MVPKGQEVIWNRFSGMIVAHACAAQVGRSTAPHGDGQNFVGNAPQELSFGPKKSGHYSLFRDVGLRIAFQNRKLSYP